MVTNKVLLAVDGTEASLNAAHYVGRMLRDNDTVIVRVLNVLPHAPPGTLESPSAIADQQGEQAWQELQFQHVHAALDRARLALMDEGIDEGHIKIEAYHPPPNESLSEALLQLARDYDCDTIAVGHHQRHRFQRLFSRDTGERLVRNARQVAVWVVDLV